MFGVQSGMGQGMGGAGGPPTGANNKQHQLAQALMQMSAPQQGQMPGGGDPMASAMEALKMYFANQGMSPGQAPGGMPMGPGMMQGGMPPR